MKALSLHQPWATLVAIGAKQVETRERWPFNHRGELAIHAAKKWNIALQDLCLTEPFRSVLQREAERVRPKAGDSALLMYLIYAGKPGGLPLGCIVARSRLNNVFRTEQVAPLVDEQERAFGDFSPGRRAIDLGPTVALPEPIPYRGLQSLFNLGSDTSDRVRELAPWPWDRVRQEVAHA